MPLVAKFKLKKFDRVGPLVLNVKLTIANERGLHFAVIADSVHYTLLSHWICFVIFYVLICPNIHAAGLSSYFSSDRSSRSIRAFAKQLRSNNQLFRDRTIFPHR